MKLKKTTPLPHRLVYILLMLLPFERIPSVGLAGVSIRPSLVVALAIIVAVAWQSPTAYYPNSLVKKALYGFLAVNLVSAVLSSHHGRALEVAGFTVFVVALALAISAVAEELNLRVAGRWLLGGAAIVGLIGLYQFFGDLSGLPTRVTGLKPAYSSQVFGFPRVQATAQEPLYLANYLLLPLAITAAGAATAAGGLVLVLLLTVLLLTLSRGGVAAAGVLTLILLGFKAAQKDLRAVAIILIAAVTATLLAYTLLADAVPALTHYRQSSQKVVATYTHQLANYEIGNVGVDRAHTRQLAIELFKNHPLIGAGPGTFGYYAHQRDGNLPVRQIVNNEPDELLAETGLLGLGTFGSFAIILAWAALKSLWRQTKDTAWAWRAALLACLVAIAVQYWSFSTLYIIHVWVAIGLLLGLVEAQTAKDRP